MLLIACMRRTLCLLGLTMGLWGCIEQVDNPAQGIFGPEVKEVALEVDYQAEAEPWTGPLMGHGRAWDLLVLNIAALFEKGPSRRLAIPTALEHMQPIAPAPADSFSRAEIWDIAQQYRDDNSTTERRVLYVVFLDGYLREDGEQRPEILGISLRDRGVIAMFSPVMRATSKLSEQTALIHELGHALGLVNIGLDMISPHYDNTNGPHCDNTDCVMFRVNRDSAMKSLYLGKLNHGKQPVLFCDQCMMDAESAMYQECLPTPPAHPGQLSAASATTGAP